MNERSYSGIYSDITDKIINAAVEVHTELGCGLKEDAYEAALALELTQRGIKVERQVPCPVVYKGVVFCQNDEHPKRIDLLVDDKIVVELKAVHTHHPIFAAQCRTYLRMLNQPVGLVLNFGFSTLKEGIEHVSNPKATASTLPTSKTPKSESNIEFSPPILARISGRRRLMPDTSQPPRHPKVALTRSYARPRRRIVRVSSSSSRKEVFPSTLQLQLVPPTKLPETRHCAVSHSS